MRAALSPRQVEILKLVAAGMTAPEVGVVLGISKETVRTHQTHILFRLRARSMPQAIDIGWRRGILP